MKAHPERLWLGLLVACAVVIWLARYVRLPFVLGMAISYVLHPLIDRLERRGVHRQIAAGVIVLTFYGLAIVGVLLFTPLLARQVIDLVTSLPGHVRTTYESLSPLIHRALALSDGENMGDLAGTVAQRIADLLAVVVDGLLGKSLAALDLVLLLAVTPSVAFYLLRDWPKLLAAVDRRLPRQHVETIRTQAHAIDAVLAGFVCGSAVVCTTLALYYAIALTLVGLESGLLIGLVAGMVSFIAYLGTLGSAAIAVTVAVFQFWPDWWRIAAVGAIFAGGEVMNDYVLTPNLVGDKVQLHPLWVLFAVFVGGSLFGFVGVITAIPVSAVIGVVARFAASRYEESALYRGDDAGDGG